MEVLASTDEDKRGKGRCTHVEHQKEGQSAKNFVEEIGNPNIDKDLEAVKENDAGNVKLQ